MMKSLVLFLLAVLQISNAQNVVHIGKIQQAQAANKAANQSPFLSTTLSTKIDFTSSSSTSSSSHLEFDTTRKSIFSETLTHFFTKIFQDQQVYDVKILSVNLFDDHILSKDGTVKALKSSTEKSEESHTLSFTTVISGEYTNISQIDSISNESFKKMLIHVAAKFQQHLIKYIQDEGMEDDYFKNIESVVLDDFERISSSSSGVSGVKGQDTGNGQGQEMMGMSNDTVNTASIIAIVIGGLVFVVLAFASVKYHKKAKQLKAARWRSKEAASMNGAASSRLRSSNADYPMPVDDYSFDPLGSSPGAGGGYNGHVPPSTYYRDDPPIHSQPSEEEEIAFTSVWPTSAPPTLFPAPGATAATPTAKLSYTQELQQLPRQHVFAPPGKIGVAIDVYNGQPVVHKVRKGSPLENMLQPNDVIVAIDETDTSCLSAADVTSMMVKRMDRVRKITFVRRS